MSDMERGCRWINTGIYAHPPCSHQLVQHFAISGLPLIRQYHELPPWRRLPYDLMDITAFFQHGQHAIPVPSSYFLGILCPFCIRFRLFFEIILTDRPSLLPYDSLRQLEKA